MQSRGPSAQWTSSERPFKPALAPGVFAFQFAQRRQRRDLPLCLCRLCAPQPNPEAALPWLSLKGFNAKCRTQVLPVLMHYVANTSRPSAHGQRIHAETQLSIGPIAISWADGAQRPRRETSLRPCHCWRHRPCKKRFLAHRGRAREQPRAARGLLTS